MRSYEALSEGLPSIVMLTFDTEKTLAHCAESIVKQDYSRDMLKTRH